MDFISIIIISVSLVFIAIIGVLVGICFSKINFDNKIYTLNNDHLETVAFLEKRIAFLETELRYERRKEINVKVEEDAL